MNATTRDCQEQAGPPALRGFPDRAGI